MDFPFDEYIFLPISFDQFGLMNILINIKMTISFCLDPFVWNISFLPFTLGGYLSLMLSYIAWMQPKSGDCLHIHYFCLHIVNGKKRAINDCLFLLYSCCCGNFFFCFCCYCVCLTFIFWFFFCSGIIHFIFFSWMYLTSFG